MHEIISKINTKDDLGDVLNLYTLSGDITEAEKPNIHNVLFDFISKEETSAWYSGAYKVLNEVDILQPNGQICRPDRVMIKDGEVIVIDYKFGEKEDKKHLRQVKFYMSRIAKMGYLQISGFVCYATLGKIICV
jgi:hypothetical protein